MLSEVVRGGLGCGHDSYRVSGGVCSIAVCAGSGQDEVMLRIGLTGGIAAGKSVVSRRLTELGAMVIDHDLLAREAVAPGTVGLERVLEAFGPGVLTESGELDRKELGSLVFGNRAALAELNAVVHPEVRRLAAAREAAAATANEAAVVVHDIPLLIETGQQEDFHVLVVVDSPADLRIRRLVELRGLTLPEARQRVGTQATDEERRAAADVVIDGTGLESELVERVDALWVRFEDEISQQSGD